MTDYLKMNFQSLELCKNSDFPKGYNSTILNFATAKNGTGSLIF